MNQVYVFISSPLAKIHSIYLKVPLFNQIENSFKKEKILTVEGCNCDFIVIFTLTI